MFCTAYTPVALQHLVDENILVDGIWQKTLTQMAQSLSG